MGLIVGCGSSSDTPPTDTEVGDGLVEDSVSPPVDGTLPDTSEDTLPPVQEPSIYLQLNGSPVQPGDVIDLPIVPVTLAAKEILSFEISNIGTGPLVLNKVMLAPFNEDGTSKNIWVVLDWGENDPDTVFPLTLSGAGQGGESTLSVDVVFAPKTLDPNDATLRVVSNDPNAPVAVIRLASLPDEPQIRVQPPQHVFSKATLTYQEEHAFEIHNDGLSPLIVDDVLLNSTSDQFVLVSKPEPGQLVKSKDKTTYQPLAFHVSYQPLFGSQPEEASVVVVSNDPAQPTYTVSLSSTFTTGPNTSPCVFGYGTEEGGVLDFGDTIAGKATKTIVGENLGEGSCVVTSIDIPTDSSGFWYSWQATLKLESGGTTPVVLPVSIEPGQTLDIEVTYAAPGYSVDGEIVIGYEDPAVHTKNISINGGGPEPCIELAPGSLMVPYGMMFAGQSLNNILRSVVVYNCGEGNLGLTNIIIQDNAGEVSTLWKLVTPMVGYTELPPHGVKIFYVSMYSEISPNTVKGVMDLTYVSGSGPKTVTVPLTGTIGADVSVPVAYAGIPDDYSGVVAGVSFELVGDLAEASGPPVAPQGYLWYLVSKPPTSTLVVNGAPGPAKRTVNADVAGQYTFGLTVVSATDSNVVSEPHTVTIKVVAPEPTDES